MRIVTAVTLALVAATAAAADAAPARRPAGVTFTDPAGDANALDGANNTASQPAFDILKVKLSPHQPTKTSSGVSVRIDLAADAPAQPGTSYVFAAKQYGCDLTATFTVGPDGTIANSRLTVCGSSGGGYSSGTFTDADFAIRGKTVTFGIPADAFVDSYPGSSISDIKVSTSAGEPASGAPSPADVDRALHPKRYRLGS